MPSRNRLYFQLRPEHVALALVGLGLFLRLHYYFSDPSIWFDEAALMLNVLDKSYAELLGPLDHAQNGPPFFCWLEKWLVSGLGDHSWVWRLPALVSSCLSLLVFFYAAKRTLPPEGFAWAVGLFAFSDRILWHTAEVKPYSVDVLVAASVLAAWLCTKEWRLTGRLLLYTFVCPPLLCLSYPSAFVFSGLVLAILPDVWKSRRAVVWLTFGLWLGAMAATFVWLALGPIHAQSQGMRAAGWDWKELMPDWSNAAEALIWPVKALFESVQYCLRPSGGLMCLFLAVGAVTMYRRGQARLMTLALTPLLAAMLAACLHCYPCGGGRPMLYMTPGVSLLIGASLPVILQWCRSFRAGGESPPTGPAAVCWRFGRWVAVAVVLGCALAPMGETATRLIVPWPRPDCRGAAAYILSRREPDDLVVVNSWDQMYFYRSLDQHYWCAWDPTGGNRGRRCWLTVNIAFPGTAELEKKVIEGHGAWTAIGRKEFGQLTVFCVERNGAAGSLPRSEMARSTR